MGVFLSIMFVLLGIVVVLFLILFHELGHFIFAKISKAYVFEFAIGFGPRLFTIKTKETWYSVRLLPLGGYVSIASDFVDPPRGREEEFDSIPDERKIDYIVKWKKTLFILTGPFFNLLLAFVLIAGSFMITGHKTNDMNFYGQIFYDDSIALKVIKTKQNSITFDSQKVAISGMKIKINGIEYVTKISSLKYSDIVNPIANTLKDINDSLDDADIISAEFQFDYKVLTDKYSDKVSYEDSTTYTSADSYDLIKWNSENKISIGIRPPTRYFSSAASALGYSFVETWNQSVSLIVGLGKFFTGDFSAISGPIGMFSVEKTSIPGTQTNYVLYIAGISANLFMLNALPFPPLDGFKFWETIIEWITKKEINKKAKTIIYLVGVVLIIALLVVVTIKDIII